MMSDKGKAPSCPQCDRPASGNFCQHCGAALGGRFCNQCGGEISAGAKFCNQCGAKVAGAAAGAGSAAGASAPAGGGASSGRPSPRREAAVSVFAGQNLAWWVAGAAMFALIVFVGVSMVRPGPGPVPAATQPTGGATPAGAASGGVPPDITSMTPIQAADRLYDRVMRSVSAGDSAQAQAFLPMAISAYQRARPLNHDGLFHLSMLNRTAGNLEAALAQAVEILDEDPNHLLGLSAAAEAAVELGEMETAAEHYQRILDVYDEESQRGLEEYRLHGTILTTLPDEARTFLDSR